RPDAAHPRGARRARAARGAAAHRKDLLMTAQRTATSPHTGAVLREAADDDVPELVDLVQAAYRGEGGWTTEAHLVDGHRTDAVEVRAMLDDPQVTLLVPSTTVSSSAAATPAANRRTTPASHGRSWACSRWIPRCRAAAWAAACSRPRPSCWRAPGWTCW